MNQNNNPNLQLPTDLPPGAFGCTPREPSESNDNLLTLLIERLDELTRPEQPGRLK